MVEIYALITGIIIICIGIIFINLFIKLKSINTNARNHGKIISIYKEIDLYYITVEYKNRGKSNLYLNTEIKTVIIENSDTIDDIYKIFNVGDNILV